MICTISGCYEKVYCKRVCLKHYNQIRQKGKVYSTRKQCNTICTVIGCGRIAYAKNLCEYHYFQSYYHHKERHEKRERVSPEEKAKKVAIHDILVDLRKPQL